jgi:hypothetical protein
VNCLLTKENLVGSGTAHSVIDRSAGLCEQRGYVNAYCMDIL